MIINLLEIPKEGLSYRLNRQTGELNEVLLDLIGKMDYVTEFTVRPIQGSQSFELSGFIQTQVPEQCSRCGIDFNLKVNELFKELLLPKLDQPRNSKYMKSNHFSDMNFDGPSVFEFEGHIFKAGEYIREVVVLSMPTIPQPAVTEDDNCTVCKLNIKTTQFNYDEDFESSKPQSPFAALKGLKLN